MHISIKTHVGMITSLSNYVGKPMYVGTWNMFHDTV